MRLKHQLFLILLTSGGLLIALMALIGSWSFDRGFVAYINDTERQRLDPLVEALASGYADRGDWGWIVGDREAWRSLMEVHLGKGRSSSRPRHEPPGPARRGGPDAGSGPRPPRGDPNLDVPTANDARLLPPSGPPFEALPGALPESPPQPLPELLPEPPSRPPPARPAGAGSPLTLDPRLLLADAERHVLIGRERGEREVRWQPITVDGATVGHLGHRQRETLTGGLDRAFAAQQRRSFLYAALAMTLLSGLLAVVLADRLVRPLLRVNDAVARIGRGQYAHRVPNARGDEIGDLSRSINTLGATLEKNLDARRQWLAEISHELRTPVAVLQGELEAIQDGVDPLDDAAIASLHAETLRLARLIDDLHDLTLADAGALDYRFERVDLAEVIAERVAATRHRVEAASLAIAVAPSPDAGTTRLPVDGDAQRLGQLVDNLLQNSLRYTDPGGEVRVTLSRADGRAIVGWSDSAPGVETAALERLFDPLYRTDASRSREHGGAGLGLAIVQRIVEAHGGTITPSHSSLGGLDFRIDLPLFRESTP